MTEGAVKRAFLFRLQKEFLSQDEEIRAVEREGKGEAPLSDSHRRGRQVWDGRSHSGAGEADENVPSQGPAPVACGHRAG